MARWSWNHTRAFIHLFACLFFFLFVCFSFLLFFLDLTSCRDHTKLCLLLFRTKVKQQIWTKCYLNISFKEKLGFFSNPADYGQQAYSFSLLCYGSVKGILILFCFWKQNCGDMWKNKGGKSQKIYKLHSFEDAFGWLTSCYISSFGLHPSPACPN